MPDVAAAPMIDTPATAPVAVVPAPAADLAPIPKTANPGATAKANSLAKLRAMAEDDGEGPEEGKVVVTEVEEPPKAKAEVKPPAQPKTEKAASTEPIKPDKEKNPGAWQLKEKWEKHAKTVEKELVEVKAKLSKAGDVEAISKRAEAAEARLAELNDEIRHVNYAKSDEFRTKYQQPYEEAWERASSDLKELTVTLPDGTNRAATPNDLVHLANLPLGEARKLANELFGDAANDVMSHRTKVRELSQAQEKALVEAKKTGAEREKQMTEAQRKMAGETAQLWQTYNAEDESKYDFLKEKEGDDAWNSKLSSSKKFVDGAFSTSVTDPKLTPEQRAEAVRKHAAVRGRAIGFSMMKMERDAAKAELAKAQKALEEYTKAEPNAGNGHGAPPPAAGRSLMEQSKAKLRTYV